MSPGLFNSILPRGQPETIIALASQGLSVDDISAQLGLDSGIVLNVLKGDHPTPEEVTNDEAAKIKTALLREAEASQDPYLRTKIYLELYKERPSARKVREAHAQASGTNFTLIQQILAATDEALLTRDRARTTIGHLDRGAEPGESSPVAPRESGS